jgi:ribosomal-protein-alanine N-acetyltransferase
VKEGLMGDAVIRKATERDFDVIYEIELMSFKDPYPHAFLQTLQSLNPETFFVAEHAGTPVGYIIATEDRGHGHILAIAVHPSEKRKGIGKRLIVELLQTLRSLGVITVRLEVRRGNIEAQKFYEYHGFIYSHAIERYYDDEDALIYYHSLQ